MKRGTKYTRLWVDRATVGFGVQVYACFCVEVPGPLGFVWGFSYGAGTAGKSRFEVLGSYVVTYARRQGVRTAINQQILAHHDVVTTQSGSKEGGIAFLKASGYALDKASGVWHLARPRRCKARPAHRA